MTARTARRNTTSLIGMAWVLIGVFVAWSNGHLTIDLFRRVVGALLAIFLWVLVLLGIDLHLT